MRVMVLAFLAVAAAAAAQAQGVLCEPTSGPIVRSDGLVVGHVDWSAPLGSSPCDTYPVRSMHWSVRRYASGGASIDMEWPWRHLLVAYPRPQQPRLRCQDAARIVVGPRGAGLYVITLAALRIDGVWLSGGAMVRVRPRPLGARWHLGSSVRLLGPAVTRGLGDALPGR